MLGTYLVHDLLSYYEKICVHNINETYICSGCSKYLNIFTYWKRLIFDNTIINKYTFLIVLLYKFIKTTTLFISFSIFIHMLDMFCIKKTKESITATWTREKTLKSLKGRYVKRFLFALKKRGNTQFIAARVHSPVNCLCIDEYWMKLAVEQYCTRSQERQWLRSIYVSACMYIDKAEFSGAIIYRWL